MGNKARTFTFMVGIMSYSSHMITDANTTMIKTRDYYCGDTDATDMIAKKVITPTYTNHKSRFDREVAPTIMGSGDGQNTYTLVNPKNSW